MTFPHHPEKGYSYLYFTEYETKTERSSILYKITQLIVVERQDLNPVSTQVPSTQMPGSPQGTGFLWQPKAIPPIKAQAED